MFVDNYGGKQVVLDNLADKGRGVTQDAISALTASYPTIEAQVREEMKGQVEALAQKWEATADENRDIAWNVNDVLCSNYDRHAAELRASLSDLADTKEPDDE